MAVMNLLHPDPKMLPLYGLICCMCPGLLGSIIPLLFPPLALLLQVHPTIMCPPEISLRSWCDRASRQRKHRWTFVAHAWGGVPGLFLALGIVWWFHQRKACQLLLSRWLLCFVTAPLIVGQRRTSAFFFQNILLTSWWVVRAQ